MSPGGEIGRHKGLKIPRTLSVRVGSTPTPGTTMNKTLNASFFVFVSTKLFAVIVNTLAILAGAIIGLVIRRGISDKLSKEILRALGLCTLIIGIKGAIGGNSVLVMILSISCGLAAGEILKLDDRVNHGTDTIIKRFSGSQGSSKLTEAFITSCLIMNVGAMVIVGSLQAGLRGDFDMLYTKSLLDFIAAIVMSAAMGAGVLGSALFTLLFQGAIVLFSKTLSPYLAPAMISELSAVGCILITALGFNMTQLGTFKIINYLPALLFVPLFSYLGL